jgi:hypothetical protein
MLPILFARGLDQRCLPNGTIVSVLRSCYRCSGLFIWWRGLEVRVCLNSCLCSTGASELKKSMSLESLISNMEKNGNEDNLG